MLPKRGDTVNTGSNPLSMVSISLTDSLPSSLGSTLSHKGSISPKLPPPSGNRLTHGRRRSSSIVHRWTFLIPRHLPLWARWGLLSLMILIAIPRGLLRGSEMQDRHAMLLAGKTKLNWAVTRLRPQKVAIYCGRKADFGTS